MTSLGTAGDSGDLEPRSEEAGTKQMKSLAFSRPLSASGLCLMWNLNYATSELIHETESDIENRLVVSQGEGG